MGLFAALVLLVREMSLFVSYVKNHTFPQPLPPVEEDAMIRRLAQGDEEARNILIEHNLRLVAHIVKKYDHGKVDPDDLISIGTIGLIKGIQTFKPDKGVRLATYAARCIENEILMHMRSQRKVSKDVSINEPIGHDKEGNEVSLIDILGTDDDEIVEGIQFRMDRDQVYDGLSVLDPREREIIWARFGLPYGAEKTQREIARELGISRSYVSRIEKRAIEKLQDQLRQHDL
ncbi:MAG: RNA polymerase sporulation sigma factor SigK [Firmicutes bacterium]|nr:RNA polymerase sporulation sigma factor SigK [Bacillota bacterium]